MKRAPDTAACLQDIPDAAWHTAAALAAVLVVFFFSELLWILFRHSPYQLFFWACLGASLLLGRGLATRFPGALRLKQVLTASVAAAALLFVMTVPLPLSALSLTVGNVTHAASLVVFQEKGPRHGVYRQVFLRPRLSSQDVFLLLPEPLDHRGGELKIAFGHQKAPYFLYCIGYGTDVLLWRIPLSTFEGKALAESVYVDESKNRFTVIDDIGRLTSRINSRPWLYLRSGEAFVRRHASRLRTWEVRLIWFALVTAACVAVIWLRPEQLPGRRLRVFWKEFFLGR